tara:strand:+ start:1211 stop:1564 length:354 start_codon:yes stop_codon:yes gene_type:complete
MRYFSYDEFDSPDQPGSGREMEATFLEKLDLAREHSGVPYVINSGFRTPEHNAKVGGVSGSSHLTGWAADIRADSSNRRFLVLRGLLAAGFNRVGIGQNFIHVDCDPSKAGNVSWLY